MLDAETVPSIDVTAVKFLVDLADDLRRDEIELVVVTVRRLLSRAENTQPGYVPSTLPWRRRRCP